MKIAGLIGDASQVGRLPEDRIRHRQYAALAIWKMDGTQIAAADYTKLGSTVVGAPGSDWTIVQHHYDIL